ncbi:MAG: hypothetical protein AB7T10_06635 [bacterium]
MNRNGHMAFGTGVGIINSLYLISDKPADKNTKDSAKIFEALLYTGTAIFGSVAPDMLEPANNPRHRKIFRASLINFKATELKFIPENWRQLFLYIRIKSINCAPVMQEHINSWGIWGFRKIQFLWKISWEKSKICQNNIVKK